MRGRVCSFQLLLDLASAVFLGSESRWTHDHILLSQILSLPQPGGAGSCIYSPPPSRGQPSNTRGYWVNNSPVYSIPIYNLLELNSYKLPFAVLLL
jgi:hypothetical protein